MIYIYKNSKIICLKLRNYVIIDLIKKMLNNIKIDVKKFGNDRFIHYIYILFTFTVEYGRYGVYKIVGFGSRRNRN